LRRIIACHCSAAQSLHQGWVEAMKRLSSAKELCWGAVS
jgi:hypothetical protein